MIYRTWPIGDVFGPVGDFQAAKLAAKFLGNKGVIMSSNVVIKRFAFCTKTIQHIGLKFQRTFVMLLTFNIQNGFCCSLIRNVVSFANGANIIK